MSKKQPSKKQVIAKIIALQKKFIKKQRESGVSSKEYYAPEADDVLRDYNEQHEKLATELVDIAHREQGTSR